MPSVIAESDLFAATMQRPNNGELADSGSLLTPLQVAANSRRYLYNRTRSRVFDATRAPYNAAGTTLVDDQPAIQAAIDAAAASSPAGGLVYLPPGAYRLDSGLTLPKTVNLIGERNGTVIVLNHATADLITFGTGIDSGMPQLVEGIGFGGLVANSGKVFTDAGVGARNVVLHDCSVGDDDANLQGYLGHFTANSRVLFDNSELHVSGAGIGILNGHADCQLNILGGKIVCPATYASTLLYYSLGGGVVLGCCFDFSLHAAGLDPTAIAVSSGPASLVNITGNRFTSAGAGPTKYAYSFDSGCGVNIGPNSYYAVNRYNSVGTLANGSSVDLLPQVSVGSSGTTYTISTGVKTTILRLTGAAPTITLPPILYPGQECELLIYNASAGNWAGVTILGGLPTSFATAVNIGTIKGLIFKAVDYDLDGDYDWVCIAEHN